MSKRSTQQAQSLELEREHVCGLCHEPFHSNDDLQEHQEEIHGRKEVETDDSGMIWDYNR